MPAIRQSILAMAIIARARGFGGGHRFGRFSGQPAHELVRLEVPARVTIPMAQGFGSALEPLVKPGDKVRAGQIVGRDDNSLSSPVHATVNGTVTGIIRLSRRNREVSGAVIESDGSAGFERLEGCAREWQGLPASTLERLIYLSGAAALAREGLPTHFRTSIIKPEEVKDIIVFWTGSEPYSPSLDILLGKESLPRFAEGLQILRAVVPQARFHLALDRHQAGIIESIGEATARFDWLRICPVKPAYPQDASEMLVPSILGQEFPFGYAAANIGAVILDIQAVLHVFEAVTEGKPVIERTIALAGPSVAAPTHLRVRAGTPVQAVVARRMKDEPVRIVLDSLLAGDDVKDLSAPVDRTVSTVIALREDDRREPFRFARPGPRRVSHTRGFLSALLPTGRVPDTNLAGEERPCVQCGFCTEVCPVRIIPHLITRTAARVGINETLVRYGVFNCIDCNLCTFVCPSKIPLAEQMLDARQKLLAVGCDNSSCVLPRFDLRGLEEYRGVKSVR